MTGPESDRDKMRDQLAYLLQRAASVDPDDALTSESPLSVEVSGKYVNVLFSTGGPHTELTAEYDDADAADAWFDETPNGAWFTFKDWGVREDVYISSSDAERIMSAVMRDWESLTHVDYPHEPGRLYDCPACESSCHCTPGHTECVFEGEHNGTAEVSD